MPHIHFWGNSLPNFFLVLARSGIAYLVGLFNGKSMTLYVSLMKNTHSCPTAKNIKDTTFVPVKSPLPYMCYSETFYVLVVYYFFLLFENSFENV